MLNEPGGLGVILRRKIAGDGLVVHVGQETIEKTPMDVVGVPRLLGDVMVHVVRDDVDFLGHNLEDQVADDEKPHPVGEGEGVVGGITVKVNRPMGSQNHHAVEEPDEEKLPGEIVEEEQEKEGGEKQHDHPAEEGQPIFPGMEKVDPGKEFLKQLAAGRHV